ncbi:MAG: 2-amino-4-hydroxy-6-hydroxymethyldihydropteridine diphosphokinase [Lutibacter sp.]
MNLLRNTYLSLGSNLGNRENNLQKAIDIIAEEIGVISKISSVYNTESWGFSGEAFLNICLEVKTKLNPDDLLFATQNIEKQLGRKSKTKGQFENRIIDIDILLFEQEIIFSNHLKVPHKELLNRNFVLIPLAEIAPNLIHPIAKQRITVLAKQSQDQTLAKKTIIGLNKPICLSEKYNYIAIEGNIGAGKTTLTKMIAEDFNAKTVLERFADNPFLPKFYEDNERYAFPLEMSFLADRYQQLTDDLAQFDLFKNFIVSDYYIFKSLIFAQVTLQKDEYFLYRKMFDIMYKEIAKPDLYIYLYQKTNRLLENIKKRGRDYEQNIEPAYLDKIHQGYASFIKTEENLNALIIDVSELDFVNHPDDYKKIISLIKNA